MSVAALERLVGDELAAAPSPEAEGLAAAIRERLGPATAAILFYGSCLRRQSSEGVLDFYALVDDYRAALDSRLLAWASAALPPTVFYLEQGLGAQALRAKVAVLTLDDFAAGVTARGLRSGIWARFCQPSLAPYVRDGAARRALAEGCARAVRTAVEAVAPLAEDAQDSEAFWQRVFAETYAREMRPESPKIVRALHAAAPQRYRRALELGLAAWEADGGPTARWESGRFWLPLDPAVRGRHRRRWQRRRPLARTAYLAQLLKTAFTFGDWLPYALWKVERHTGHRVAYSERQRRHPLIFGWPLLWRILRAGSLR